MIIMQTRNYNTKPTIEGNKVSGYAIVYNEVGDAYDKAFSNKPYKETIKQGAVKFHKDRPLILYWNHDYKSVPLANSKNGTLEYGLDDKGLWFKADLPQSATREREAIARGDVSNMSFGMNIKKDRFLNGIRELHDVEIGELSICPDPAYPQTSVSLRSRNECLIEIADKLFLEDNDI
jgi:HK97 family phage prohead protease